MSGRSASRPPSARPQEPIALFLEAMQAFHPECDDATVISIGYWMPWVAGAGAQFNAQLKYTLGELRAAVAIPEPAPPQLDIQRLRQLAKPTVEGWAILMRMSARPFEEEWQRELTEALASYGEMLITHHLPAAPSAVGAPVKALSCPDDGFCWTCGTRCFVQGGRCTGCDSTDVARRYGNLSATQAAVGAPPPAPDPEAIANAEGHPYTRGPVWFDSAAKQPPTALSAVGAPQEPLTEHIGNIGAELDAIALAHRQFEDAVEGPCMQDYASDEEAYGHLGEATAVLREAATKLLNRLRAAVPYDYWKEADIVCEAIGSHCRATVRAALHEAYEAGLRAKGR